MGPVLTEFAGPPLEGRDDGSAHKDIENSSLWNQEKYFTSTPRSNQASVVD